MREASTRLPRTAGILCGFASCLVLVCAPTGAQAREAAGCRPLRAIFYVSSGWLQLARALDANASACAQYFISVPPLTANKTEMRTGVAAEIRAFGANFHALAEVNVGAWQEWVATTGHSWYEAGVEARSRMAAAGFEVSAGDSWAVNEFSSSVRDGTGASRQDMSDLLRGLYQGGASVPPTKGVVFVEGVQQSTPGLRAYKASLESWFEDAGFWTGMSGYVSDFLQEAYGDVRDYGVSYADLATRLTSLRGYLEYELQLASVSPAPAAAARDFLQASYAPLADAAWEWTSIYGYTAVPYQWMEDYISAEVDAMRSYDASIGLDSDRVGFAWAPANRFALSASAFRSETAAILTRLAVAIQASADPASPGAGACQPPWCRATFDGASFTAAWDTFSRWTPTRAAFASRRLAVAAGSAARAIGIELEVGDVVTALPVAQEVVISLSAGDGSLSIGRRGPWTSTLHLTLPAGSTRGSFYVRDPQPGTLILTAATDGDVTTQTETVTSAPSVTTSTPADN